MKYTGIESFIFDEEFTSLESDFKEKLIGEASTILDNSNVWKGDKQKDSLLEFPRVGEDTVPLSLKYAVAKIAIDLYYYSKESENGQVSKEEIPNFASSYFQKPSFLGNNKKTVETYCSNLIKRTVGIQ